MTTPNQAEPPAATHGDRLSRRERLVGSFPALTNRDFRYLAASSTASSFAQWAKTIGLGWLVFELTGSAAQLGGVSFVRGLVGLVASPWAGVLLDRGDRHRVLVATTMLNATLAVALATLIVTDLVRVEHIYVLAVLDGILSSTEGSARQTVVYEVTADETLANAITVNTIAINVARIAGPPFTGAIIGIGGTAAAFIFLAMMSVLSAVLTLRIRTRRSQRNRSGGRPWRDLWDGLRYISGDRPILGVVLSNVVASLLVYPYIALLPIFADEVLHSGAIGYGLLSSALGWGSLIGLLIIAFTGSSPRRRGLLLYLGALGYIGCVLAFSQSPYLVLSFTLLALGGLSNSFWFVLSTQLIQLLASDHMRGRTLSVWQMAGSATPLGVLPMGILVATLGPQTGVALFSGSALVLTAIMMFKWRSLRTI